MSRKTIPLVPPCLTANQINAEATATAIDGINQECAEYINLMTLQKILHLLVRFLLRSVFSATGALEGYVTDVLREWQFDPLVPREPKSYPTEITFDKEKLRHAFSG